MQYGTLGYWAEIVEDCIKNRKKITYCVIGNGKTVVSYGFEEDCNTEWCNEHDIPCYNILRSAGCCVCAVGSVNIADIRPHKGEFVEQKIISDFRNWLKSRGVESEIDHNDILIDGLKVASAGGYNLSPDYKWQYTGIQISVNQDYYVIAHACKKPSTKRPGALSDYGVTTLEVLKWCEKWFEEYDEK